MNASILIHPELGIGADAILPEKRIIAPSLCRQIIRRALLMESLGEELRVLYVALTRAKKKLDPQWNYWSPCIRNWGIVRIKGQ